MGLNRLIQAVAALVVLASLAVAREPTREQANKS